MARWDIWSKTPDDVLSFDSLGRDHELLDGKNDQFYYNEAMKGRKYVIDAMEKITEAFKRGDPVFGRINTGAREGSIVRIAPSSITLSYGAHAKSCGYNRVVVREGPSQDDPRVWCRIEEMGEDRVLAGLGLGGLARINHSGAQFLTLYMTEYLAFNTSNLVYEFDGRKPVKSNVGDQQGFEFLPDYTGPTVFMFTKAASKSPEEKRAEAEANKLAIVPLDMFGNKLGIGDMFIYARNSYLVIGRLKRTTAAGYIIADTILDKKEVSLQGEASREAMLRGQNNPALLRFSKDEVLSTTLMMEKLKR